MNERPISLIDQIKMHIQLWMNDNQFTKLNKNLSQSLKMVFNEIKLRDAMISTGAGQLKENQTPIAKQRKIFVASFKQRYLQNIDFKYEKPLTPVTNAILTKTIQRLLLQGSNSQQFLEWLWVDFFTLQKNKKYLPADINFVCNSWIIDKFLYVKKESLKIRKKDLVDISVKNQVIELATVYLQKYKEKQFGQKLLVFSRGQIDYKKFVDYFNKNILKVNDEEIKQKLKEITEK